MARDLIGEPAPCTCCSSNSGSQANAPRDDKGCFMEKEFVCRGIRSCGMSGSLYLVYAAVQLSPLSVSVGLKASPVLQSWELVLCSVCGCACRVEPMQCVALAWLPYLPPSIFVVPAGARIALVPVCCFISLSVYRQNRACLSSVGGQSGCFPAVGSGAAESTRAALTMRAAESASGYLVLADTTPVLSWTGSISL